MADESGLIRNRRYIVWDAEKASLNKLLLLLLPWMSDPTEGFGGPPTPIIPANQDPLWGSPQCSSNPRFQHPPNWLKHYLHTPLPLHESSTTPAPVDFSRKPRSGQEAQTSEPVGFETSHTDSLGFLYTNRRPNQHPEPWETHKTKYWKGETVTDKNTQPKRKQNQNRIQ
jgi:hypothetical protein